MSNEDFRYELATPLKRLQARFLDFLFIVASSILAYFFPPAVFAWFIWCAFTMKDGQTPGHKILKLRTYDRINEVPARWSRMFLREFAIYFIFSLLCQLLAGIINSSLGIHLPKLNNAKTITTHQILSYYTAGSFIYLLLAGTLVDYLWIFKGGARHRLVDLICKTDVVNESIAIAVPDQPN